MHSSDLREEINDVYADPAYKEGKGSRSLGKKNCSCLWYHSLRMSQKKDPIGRPGLWIKSDLTTFSNKIHNRSSSSSDLKDKGEECSQKKRRKANIYIARSLK